MKRIVLILAIAGLTANGMAQDTIRLTWKGSTSEKTIYVGATPGTGNIIINWGDGTPSTTHNGAGNSIPISHTYTDTNSYNVLIATPNANTKLSSLFCSDNQLTALDVSGATELWRLRCIKNQLTALDISGCTRLYDLYCDDNQLLTLHISQNTSLTRLDCYNNQLTALDVNGCTALAALYCNDNQLTTLDVSGCTKLTDLHCSDNQLTTLNVSGCTKLTTLSCSDNQLTALDVSVCTALTTLYCDRSQLTALDVSGCTALTRLACGVNQLPLSQLYPIWINKRITSSKSYGGQEIYDTVVINRIINLSNELAFGSPAVQTRVDITMKDGSPAADNYTFEDGELIFTALGDYKVVMRNDSVREGITATGIALFVTYHYHVREISTSIEEIEKESISIYPNPTKGQLTVDNGQGIIDNVEVCDISGRTVFRHCERSETIQTIDLSHLANGIYIVKIKTEEGEVVKKIVKQ